MKRLLVTVSAGTEAICHGDINLIKYINKRYYNMLVTKQIKRNNNTRQHFDSSMRQD
jgi:hypothetical protein